MVVCPYYRRPVKDDGMKNIVFGEERPRTIFPNSANYHILQISNLGTFSSLEIKSYLISRHCKNPRKCDDVATLYHKKGVSGMFASMETALGKDYDF